MIFFSFSFCLAGDDSVNAGGLDVTAVVAFAVVSSDVVSEVVVASAIASIVAASAAAFDVVDVVAIALFW